MHCAFDKPDAGNILVVIETYSRHIALNSEYQLDLFEVA